MYKIYVPYENKSDYACYSVLDSGTIRAYKQNLSNNNDIQYTDFFVNSHYLQKDGVQHIQNKDLITCVNDNVTNDYYYRNDFPMILITFVLLVIICFYVPWKIFIRLFRRYQ